MYDCMQFFQVSSCPQECGMPHVQAVTLLMCAESAWPGPQESRQQNNIQWISNWLAVTLQVQQCV